MMYIHLAFYMIEIIGLTTRGYLWSLSETTMVDKIFVLPSLTRDLPKNMVRFVVILFRGMNDYIL